MFCNSCGADNPDSARFCGTCGSPLAGGAAAFHYAGFWIRFAARVLDGMIVGCAGFALAILPATVMVFGARGRDRVLGPVRDVLHATGTALQRVDGVVADR